MIYVVIPVFNRREFTKACLYTLTKQTINDYKIIVVDHGSSDGTSEMIKDTFKEVILVTGTSDLWWAGAMNLGVREALKLSDSEDDFLLSLNNDLIVEEAYLENLLKVYHQNKPCLVGSTSVHLNNSEKIHFTGIIWNPISAKFKNNPEVKERYSDLAGSKDFLKSDLLPGRGTLIPVKAFKEYGLYDERKFPHYAADEDFSLVCQTNNYKLVVATKAVVKSHVTDTGLNVKYKNLSVLQFIKTLSSIKSANNLKIRYNWAKKNTPYPYFYFIIDCIRIFGSYGRSLIIGQKSSQSLL